MAIPVPHGAPNELAGALPHVGVDETRTGYPVAVDSDYAIWGAFANRYWPAVYVADANGTIRFHHFGEGRYDEIERIIQQLRAAAARHRTLQSKPPGCINSAGEAYVRSGRVYTSTSSRILRPADGACERVARCREPSGDPYYGLYSPCTLAPGAPGAGWAPRDDRRSRRNHADR
jgi:hypothetical protein